MSRYAIVSYVDSSQRFAVLVEGEHGVDTIGVSPQGKEWERWADALPVKSRRTIEQLLPSLGSHLTVKGPATLSKAQKLEFDELVAENVPTGKES